MLGCRKEDGAEYCFFCNWQILGWTCWYSLALFFSVVHRSSASESPMFVKIKIPYWIRTIRMTEEVQESSLSINFLGHFYIFLSLRTSDRDLVIGFMWLFGDLWNLSILSLLLHIRYIKQNARNVPAVETHWLGKFHTFGELIISECDLYSMVPNHHMELKWKHNL